MIQQIFCHYFMLNFLLTIGYVCTNLLRKKGLKNAISFKQQLKIARFLLLYIPCIYFLIFIIKSYYWHENTFIFQLPGLSAAIANTAPESTLQKISLSKFRVNDYFYTLLLSSLAIIFLLKTKSYILQLRKLKQLVSHSICLKRYNNLYIVVSDTARIPFCFSYFKQSYIVVTNELIENLQHYNLAIKHELQHLRQKDTLWIYIFELFKVIFYFNPLVHFWIKYNLELQEFACDEALIKEKSIFSHDYANCLLAAAEQAQNKDLITKETFSAAVALFHSKKSLTTRRISMIFEYKKTSTRQGLFLLISILMSLIIATTSYAVGVASSTTNKTLDNPLLKNDYILKWSNEAVSKSFTYNYKNYKKNLENTSHYFTIDGWKNFMKAVKASGNIEAVVAKKLTVSASFNNSPTIIKQGIEDGKYSWHVKIPMNIIYLGHQEHSKQNVLVNLLIIRTNDTPNRIGISQYIITPAKQ